MKYNFLIVDNSIKDINREVFNRVADALEKEFGVDSITIEYRGLESLYINKDYYMIISIGGDGTVLKVLDSLNGREIPVIGINLGRVGFLAEIEPEDIEKAIHKIYIGAHYVKRYNYIEGFGNDSSISFCAVNDVIIGKSNFLGTIEIELIIDGISVNKYICDGLNISTALGSTAYNKALNGSVVFPDSSVFIISPIGTDDNLFKSLIIPDAANIEIKVHRSGYKGESVLVGFDGIKGFNLKAGESIYIKKSQKMFPLLHLNNYNYYEVLKKK